MTNKIVKIGRMVGKATVAVKAAAEALAAGEVIAVPTDTIYGIAALVQNKQAVEKLYTIKKRNPSKPIAICVAEIDEIYNWADVTVAREVIEDLLPGQVTLVFRRSDLLNNNFNPDTELVGVRIPDYPFLREVCSMSSGPLALTSANYSADTSTLQVEEFAPLHDSLHTVFDGGRLHDSENARLGSTVIDLSQVGTFTIIRPGSVREKAEKIMKLHGLEQR
eukprot:TRINITY_DN11248_c0_g1_i2.p1 TRINITY_DN11248_c0_g1~~TRINITY_DN11248_c0_g1_i2.p1  ORF type:complete len:221 (+),score=77.05 TRINITY_DN11248_c0_g1_i2:53-715(+)